MTLNGVINTSTSTATNAWCDLSKATRWDNPWTCTISTAGERSYIDDLIYTFPSDTSGITFRSNNYDEAEFCVDRVFGVNPYEDGSVILWLGCGEKTIKIFLSAEHVKKILAGIGEFCPSKTFEEGLESFLDPEKE